MDPTAFSLALGILMYVLSYSCLGLGGAFSLSVAGGTSIAMWLGRLMAGRTSQRNEPATEYCRVRVRTHASTIARSS